MRIIVINLARATERRNKITAQFAAFGLPFEFLTATDGRALTQAERDLVDHDRRKSITRYPLSDNEVGCWLSHRRAMQSLLDSGEKMACIIEDDAVLSPDFPRMLQAIENGTHPFDVIDLHRLFKRGEIFLPVHQLMPDCALGRVGYTHMHATAYVMSRAGAQKFMPQAARFAHAIDKELHSYWRNGLDLYGIEKPVAAQDDGGHSFIDETRGQDRPKERATYPDADTLQWRIKRQLTKWCDSLAKRRAFARWRKQAAL